MVVRQICVSFITKNEPGSLILC